MWKRRVARKNTETSRMKVSLDTLPSQTAYPAGFWDTDPWLTPGCLSLIPQMWQRVWNKWICVLYNYRWSCYVTWKSYSIFFKWLFDPSDPRWPQINIWPHNIGRGSHVDAHVRVLGSCYVTWTSYSILVKMTFWPQWPQMTPRGHLTPLHR